MCDHSGTFNPSKLRAMQLGRRGFLRATAASTLTLAAGAGAARMRPRRISNRRMAQASAT